MGCSYVLFTYTNAPLPPPAPAAPAAASSVVIGTSLNNQIWYDKEKNVSKLFVEMARIEKQTKTTLARWSGEDQFRPVARDMIDPSYNYNNECKWLGTRGCTPYGKLNDMNAACQDVISPSASGICQCTDGSLFGKSCTTGTTHLYCSEVCNKQKPAFETYPELKRFDNQPQVRGAFVTICRSRQYTGLTRSLRSLTKSFNKKRSYPVVVIHDPQDKFSDALRKGVGRAAGNSVVHFVMATFKFFAVPRRVNLSRVGLQRSKRVQHMDSLPFRQMSRYMAGFFFREHLFDSFDYVLKFEVGMMFLCDVPYDPFLLMKANNKTVGFNMMYHEFAQLMPSLADHIVGYQAENPDTSHVVLSQFVGGGGYSGCSFGSSFMVLSLDYLRSPAYQGAFAHLDKTDGFFYERWSFYPVTTLIAAIIAPPEKWIYLESVAVTTPVNGYHVPSDPFICRNEPVPQRIGAVCLHCFRWPSPKGFGICLFKFYF